MKSMARFTAGVTIASLTLIAIDSMPRSWALAAILILGVSLALATRRRHA